MPKKIPTYRELCETALSQEDINSQTIENHTYAFFRYVYQWLQTGFSIKSVYSKYRYKTRGIDIRAGTSLDKPLG